MSTVAQLSIRLGADWSDVRKAFNDVGAAVRPLSEKLTQVGSTLTRNVTLPMVAFAAASLKASIDFETAFAGVRKTVDATEAEFAMLEKGIRDMSKEIPSSASEIAGVAEAAGQLGIATPNILAFTRVMIDLGNSTNLSAGEAATSLARLANITQMPQDEFERLGSVIVALGNNLATTEAEIVEMGLRLAGAGKQIGLTEGQILGFAAALSSVGINAEAGGSAMSKVFVQIASDVASGGGDLQTFASIAGMSAEQFRVAFQQDAAGAIVSFVEGLGQIAASGGNVFGVLESLGITEVRMRDALLRASGAGDLLRQSLDLQNVAWDENLALSTEAAQRYGTTASMLKVLWNRMMEVFRAVGDALVPVMLEFLSALDPLFKLVERAAQGFRDLDPTIQKVIIGVAGLVAAIGPLLFGIGAFLKAVPLFVAGFTAMSGPIGLIILALGAFVAALAVVTDESSVLGAQIGQNVLRAFREVFKVIHIATTGLQIFGVISDEAAMKVHGLRASLDTNIAAGDRRVKELKATAGETTNVFQELADKIKNASLALKTMGDPEIPTLPGTGGGQGGGFTAPTAMALTPMGLQAIPGIPAPGALRGLGQAAITEMDALNAAMAEKKARFGELVSGIGQIITDGLGAAITTLAEGFGQMAAGTASLGDVAKNLLGVFANIMGKLGAMLIAYGLAGKSWNLAGGFASFLNPLSAAAVVAIGAGLVAGAGAIKGFLSKATSGGGGGVGGTVSPINVNANAANFAPSQIAPEPVQVQLQGVTVPSGNMVFSQVEGSRRLDLVGTKLV